MFINILLVFYLISCLKNKYSIEDVKNKHHYNLYICGY